MKTVIFIFTFTLALSLPAMVAAHNGIDDGHPFATDTAFPGALAAQPRADTKPSVLAATFFGVTGLAVVAGGVYAVKRSRSKRQRKKP